MIRSDLDISSGAFLKLRNQLGHFLAAASRHAPFERGRWRLGALAYDLVQPGLGEPHTQVSTREGFRLNLDLRQFVDRTIYCTGGWEPHEAATITRVLRAGDHFVDVGANIGYFTMLAAGCVGPSGKVTAIEANAKTHAVLARNIALNGIDNIRALHLAVGAEDGTAFLDHLEEGNRGGDRALLQTDGSADGTIRMRRLDDILADEPLRLIKLDIEGGEAKALRGAEGILEGRDAPDLLFELTPEWLEELGDDSAELMDWLCSLGYRLTEVATHGEASGDLLTRRQTSLHCSKR